ncbi:MAG: chemotaxis protein CheW [Vicinamibacteria bacterium]
MSRRPEPMAETINGTIDEILRKRAARYSEAPIKAVVSRSLGDFVGCRIAGQSIGLPMNVVEEFAPLLVFTPLPGIEGVLGVTQLRGEFLSVLDLGKLLLGKAMTGAALMVVLSTPSGRSAALVDEILGKRPIFESDLLPESQVALPGPAFVAMTRELWALVDASRLARLLDHAALPAHSDT